MASPSGFWNTGGDGHVGQSPQQRRPENVTDTVQDMRGLRLLTEVLYLE